MTERRPVVLPAWYWELCDRVAPAGSPRPDPPPGLADAVGKARARIACRRLHWLMAATVPGPDPSWYAEQADPDY